MDSQQLCRLCLQSGDDLVNIWENFEDSTIATVVQKHFWFQVRWRAFFVARKNVRLHQVSKGDSFPEWLCAACWMQTKTFHNFYLNIECRHASFYKTVNSVSSNLSPQERCGSPAVAELDIDLNSVKCEEPEVETKVVNFLIDEKRKSDVNDGSSSEQSIHFVLSLFSRNDFSLLTDFSGQRIEQWRRTEQRWFCRSWTPAEKTD